MPTTREILARVNLSPSEAAGAAILDEYRRVRERLTLTKRHATLLRRVRRDLVAAAERLDAAMRRGDRWEVGNALLGARQLVRAAAARIESRARRDKAPSLRFDFSWPLDIADRQLLDHEVTIATAANHSPRELGSHGARPSDDGAGLAALHVAIATLDNHLAGRGHPPDHAMHLLLFMVADLPVDRDEVPKVAAALLVAAGESTVRLSRLTKRMETVHSRHPTNR